MKALLFQSPDAPLTLEEVPLPPLEADQLRVRVRSAGICGTDLHFYLHDELAQGRKLRYPYILGHEMAGEVTEVGKKVTRFAVGDRVTTETHVPCGKCFYCLSDRPHICISLESFAQKVGGVFAQYCRVPEGVARRLPEGVDFRLGSMMEPLGVAVRAVLEAECPGDTLLITGCGPIGLMTIAVAKALGVGRIFASEVVPERLQLAKKMGADFLLDGGSSDAESLILAATQGLGVGAWIEASGSPSAILLGLRTIRKGGRAILFGLGTKATEMDVSKWIVSKELHLRGILGRRMFDTWMKMEMLVQRGALDLEPVMGESFPLERFRDAFAMALSGKTGKIFLVP